ncbi:hypothetical protein tb265_47190 [Gemmatimonadetes bacterium T265]|nr:hypothetical protein tb265_47190 [Gemmatimonadetes bacterium T265]
MDLSGNVYFGAASHRLASATLSGGHSDSALATHAELDGSYGDSEGERKGVDVWRVTVRDARLRARATLRPYARLSAFVAGSDESNFQEAIADRVSGRVGAVYGLWRPPSPTPASRFAQYANLNLALVTEHTRALDPAGARGAGGRTRVSLGTQMHYLLPAGVRLSHETSYEAAVGGCSGPAKCYVIETSTGLGVPLAKRTEFTATLQDRYDSEARLRTARSNTDGRVLFGVRVGL